MSVTVDYSIKRFFFDRKKIVDRIEKMKLRSLSRMGAIIRSRSRRQILHRKTYRRRSAGGQSPISHRRPGLRTILFGLNPQNESVIVGPVRLNTMTNVASVLEKGGVSRFKGWRGKIYTKRYAARPFMKPGLDQSIRDLPDVFKGAFF